MGPATGVGYSRFDAERSRVFLESKYKDSASIQGETQWPLA